MKTFIFVSVICIALFASLSLTAAVAVTNVDVDPLRPGGSSSISLEVENILDTMVEDVSVSLQLANTPFTPIGSSQDTVDEIDEGDEERFSFTLKSANDIRPGDYQVPYIVTYSEEDSSLRQQLTGSFGVTVEATADLEVTLAEENAIVGQQGRLLLRVVNKGFADARFVSITLNDDDYTVLSEKEVYIGTIDSDDFETADFDVLFKKSNPTVSAELEYVDFNNKRIYKPINLPATVYTPEKALELGITKKSNAGLYVALILIVVVIFFTYRAAKKRRRLQKSMQSG